MSAKLEDIVSLAKRRGFIYQGSEIYGGLAGTWDYGPLGVRLKHNIENAWWQQFVENREDMYPLDAAILMPAKVWEASGHLEGFNDPLVECSHCHSRFRADHIEGDKCPHCGKEHTFGEVKQFNMMFPVKVGATEDAATAYLRGETAQGIFTNFKNVVDSFSPDMPFGIAQIGKAFRNEISPRDFIFRDRELEMMEIEYFIDPKKDDWQKLFDYWLDEQKKYLETVGVDTTQIKQYEHPDEDRSHYSQRTVDWEFEYPFGRKELTGLAYRTDYDLSAHIKHSGKNLAYQPKDGGEPFVPHVLEPTFGIERTVLAVLTSAYTEDEQGGEKRVFLKLKPEMAPVKVAVFPLLKNKPELVKKAREVYQGLKDEIGSVMWDDNGNIGKRYRRQDEIGTPYCVTVDFDSLEDDTVTLRDRDTTEQKRFKLADLHDELHSKEL